MAKKCKKGFKKVGNMCVTEKSFKRFGQLANEVKILKIVLITSITSIGGWAMFSAIRGIFGLEGLNDWILLVAGILILIATYKFGWKQIIRG